MRPRSASTPFACSMTTRPFSAVGGVALALRDEEQAEIVSWFPRLGPRSRF